MESQFGWEQFMWHENLNWTKSFLFFYFAQWMCVHSTLVKKKKKKSKPKLYINHFAQVICLCECVRTVSAAARHTSMKHKISWTFMNISEYCICSLVAPVSDMLVTNHCSGNCAFWWECERHDGDSSHAYLSLSRLWILKSLFVREVNKK